LYGIFFELSFIIHFSILFLSINTLIEKLQQNNVPTAIYYKYPIHLMKAFSYLGYQKGDFPISEILSRRILS
jgi:UDP-2-acetamido-2-deoxy-ribo-hexuluronate aminotransferase